MWLGDLAICYIISRDRIYIAALLANISDASLWNLAASTLPYALMILASANFFVIPANARLWVMSAVNL